MFTFDIEGIKQDDKFKRKPLISKNKHKNRKETYTYTYYVSVVIISVICVITFIKMLMFKYKLNMLDKKNHELMNEQELQKEKNMQMDIMINKITKEKEEIIKNINEQKNITETKQQELEKLKKQNQLRNVMKDDLYLHKYVLPWNDFSPFNNWSHRKFPLIPY